MGYKRGKSRPVSFADLGNIGRRNNLLGQAISVGRLAKKWESIVGPPLAQKTSPVRVNGKTLTVNVSDSPLLQQLSFIKQDLLHKIRQNLPETSIESIKFKIGKIL